MIPLDAALLVAGTLAFAAGLATLGLCANAELKSNAIAHVTTVFE
jgi:hypothetical protein